MVLNGKGDSIKISKETQKRVFEKAKELKYAPNQFARALRLGKSSTIGLIVPDITNPFYSRLALIIESELNKHQYKLLICNTGENPTTELEIIKNLQARAVEGIFLASCQRNPKELIELSTETIPLILLDRVFENCPLHSFSADNRSAGEKVAGHFLKSGFKKIAVIGLKPVYVSSINSRLTGFIEKLKRDGKFSKSQIQLFEIAPEKYEQAIQKILIKIAKEKTIDAIFALNNVAAVAVLKVMKKIPLSSPKNFSLFSFDDLDAFELCHPSISAVEQPIDQMGRAAADRMILCLKNTEFQDKITIEQFPVKIIVRESCP